MSSQVLQENLKENGKTLKAQLKLTYKELAEEGLVYVFGKE